MLVVSAREGRGLDTLLAQVRPGETCVLIGSSGVGKSTLVNAFLGEDRMATKAIRGSDDQGRHTTSHRQLILLPGGQLILDTPGMREIGLIDADEGVSVVFDDIERLAQDCRFNDCGHASEPGCAVRGALQSGALNPARWAHFQKLAVELTAAEEKVDRAAQAAERRRPALQKIYRTTKRDRGCGLYHRAAVGGGLCRMWPHPQPNGLVEGPLDPREMTMPAYTIVTTSATQGSDAAEVNTLTR